MKVDMYQKICELYMVRSMYCGKVRFNLRNMPMTLEILIDIFNMRGPGYW